MSIVKFHYQVGRLQGSTLKLGEYKINDLGRSISMASLVFPDSFVYGLPRLIETKLGVSKTSDRTPDAKYVLINYRVDIPAEVSGALFEVVSNLDLVGGEKPWTSQYVLVLELSEKMMEIESENSIEYRAFYRGLYLLDGVGSVLFKHNPKKRRGKNRKDYN